MTVYVDEAIWHWHGRRWCHLMADDIDELHRFAHRLGLHLSSYQGPPKTAAPHYDITGHERGRAIRLGAVPVGRREIVALLKKVRVEGTFVRTPADRPRRLGDGARTAAGGSRKG
jgi:hypothetical protein